MEHDVQADLIDQLVQWGIREGVVTLADSDNVTLRQQDDGNWWWSCDRCPTPDGIGVGGFHPSPRNHHEGDAKEHARRKHGEKVFVRTNDGETEEIQ